MDFVTNTIFECNKERRLITRDEIKSICNYICNLQGYKINGIEIYDVYNKYPKDTGLYSRKDKKLYFFYDGIINNITDSANAFRELYNTEGSIFDNFNFFFLICILHELAHVRQDYITELPRNTLEKKIFSIFLRFTDDDPFYRDIHDIDLKEVNAFNVSYINAYNIYKKLPGNFFTKEDLKGYQLATIKWLLQGNYDIVTVGETINSPAEKVADTIIKNTKITTEEYAKLIYSNDDITLYKKLALGLPISYLEYAYVNLLIDELESGIEIDTIKRLQKKIIL